MTSLYLKTLIIFSTFLSSMKETKYCSCWPLDSQEEEYRRSSFVIQGRIIASEDYRVANSIVHNQNGVKFGKSKVELDSSDFIRHTIIVERNFKKDTKVSDTIYLIAKQYVDCGPHIERYSEFIKQELPQELNLFIYADRFHEFKKIDVIEGGGKIKSIIEIVHENIFYGERCRRIQRVNNDELIKLEDISR